MREEFLAVIESMRAQDASATRLFEGEGQRIRRGPDPRFEAMVIECAIFVAEVVEGKRPLHHLKEAMSTSDFPLLYGTVLDRQILQAYREFPATWTSIARRVLKRDFRVSPSTYLLSGGDGRLSQVAELSEYPEGALAESQTPGWRVFKYGRRLAFSWESIVDDDLDLLTDGPIRLGRAARRTENWAATELYVDASGPRASFYNNTNKNLINIANGATANNPALSIAALQDAFRLFSNLTDPVTGEPILMEAAILRIPPALQVVAENILNATQIELTTAGGVRDGGTGEQRLIAANWMRSRLTLEVDPYIPRVATTANGNTSWFLFANVATSDRPALELGFLRGHEEPELRVKEPNSRLVGGGQINPADGDFDTDSIQYRVRQVIGSNPGDFRATVASNGSGA